MTTCKLTYNDLSSLLHAMEMTPLMERPNRSTINKIAAAYKREGGEPYDEFPDLSPTATGLPKDDRDV